MATSVDKNLNEFYMNSVASEEVLEDMRLSGQLEPNQLYMTPDLEDSSSGGSKVIWEVWE